MIVNFYFINPGALASSTPAQTAIDQWASRKCIFSNCNIVFLNVKAQKQKQNKTIKNWTPKALHLTIFCYVVV